MLKKIISSVLSVMILSSAMLSNVYADDTVRGIFPKEQSVINFGVELMDMYESKAFEIYMALLGINTDTTELKVEFETPIKLDAKTQEEITTVDMDKLEAVSDDAQMAIDAFKADYPEIFWYDISNSSSKAILGAEKNDDGSQYFVIKGIRLILNVLPEYEDSVSTAYDNVLNELNQVVAATEGMDRYNTLKYFHDYLCDTIEYGDNGKDSFNLHGALVNKIATCEGYSESFKALCDLAGIPCIVVRGKSIGLSNEEVNHMWNYCLMEDDKWYAVDVTWDDPGYPSYDFFLVGSKTVVMINDRTFAHTHLALGDFSFSGIHEFLYPELNATAYDYIEFMYGDVNADGKINSSDALDVLKEAAKMREFNEKEFKAANVDGNDDTNATDALYILKYAARIIDRFPVEI